MKKTIQVTVKVADVDALVAKLLDGLPDDLSQAEAFTRATALIRVGIDLLWQAGATVAGIEELFSTELDEAVFDPDDGDDDEEEPPLVERGDTELETLWESTERRWKTPLSRR